MSRAVLTFAQLVSLITLDPHAPFLPGTELSAEVSSSPKHMIKTAKTLNKAVSS